jgi:ureidoglycolate lyase
MLITPKTLTAAAFLPFGEVIEASTEVENFSINDGYTQRYHNLAKVDVNAKSGQAGMSIFRSTPLARPIAIKMMERHPLASQAFMPLGNEPYLVVVAPKGELDVKQIEVFIATAGQGVNYSAGTWHHYCLALNKSSDFLVVDRIGEGDNCDVVELDGSLVINI